MYDSKAGLNGLLFCCEFLFSVFPAQAGIFIRIEKGFRLRGESNKGK